MSTGKAALSSLEGQGGTQPMPQPKAGPRYIYYRVYTNEGALESNNPIYHSDDRFISRILPKSVAPPHTADSLKNHLCRIEGLEGLVRCTLYSSLSDQTPVEDSARLALRGTAGPGVSELDPVALVVEMSDAERRLKVSSEEAKNLLESSSTRCYVYYRVYDKGGEIPSKTSFDETDSSLGRIDTLSVPPPHTSSSLKSRLNQAEGVSPDRGCKLFEDEGGENALNDGDPITLLADRYPGVSRDEPIAIVYEPQKDGPSAAKEPSFTKKLIANASINWADYDSRWHTMTSGEIFHTDGILTTKPYTAHGRTLPCYAAINSAGKKAFVVSQYTSLC